ncbi:NADH-quinone oxidoreductase subunit C [Gemmatimonadota bacterium]
MEPVNEHKIFEALTGKFDEKIVEHGLDKGDAVAIVAADAIHDVMAFLRDEFAFDMPIDICGVDYLPRKPRFEVVYILHSTTRNERIRLHVQLGGKSPQLATVTDLYPVADWLEREVWDMFGIVFTGHPNLKRILMYEPFEGHPLRRDYPINKRQPLIGPQN